MGRLTRIRQIRVVPALLALFVSPLATRAQTVWNDARAIELMERARVRRTLPVADSLLRNYQAVARGMVYFYLDRRDARERTLVKTDQLALEVFWAAPNRTKQRIVGRRDDSRLPNRMYYHLDHLTVVQNEFGNAIRLGGGDEVRDVPHPAAAGSDSLYDYRLSDSLTIVLPGAPEPIRAYEIEVRPRRPDRPAFVGSLFVDRSSADIVRMTFTFTPSSYLDPRLDHISISLDNSLWDGRYWLPYEQHLEIRRQIPELDFVAGSIIQARFRITDYEFNQDLPPSTFLGPPVVTVPREQRESFPFEEGLYDDLDEAGLAPPPSLEQIRATAARIVGQSTLSGLPRLRLALNDASDVFRYNRAEGVYVGGGTSYRLSERASASLGAGFTVGPERPYLMVGLQSAPTPIGIEAEAWLNELRDVGVRAGMPGVLNTLTSLARGDDYLDPYHASGARITLTRAFTARARMRAALRSERHRSLPLSQEDSPLGRGFRGVRPIDEGWLHALSASFAVDPGEAGTRALDAWIEGGLFEGHGFARAGAGVSLQRASTARDRDIRFRLAAGAATSTAGTSAPAQGALPAQLHFLLGGRHTLPGYAYRSFIGDAFLLAGVTASRDLVWPIIRLRVTGAAGWTHMMRPPRATLDGPISDPLRAWNTSTTDGLRLSAGVGAGVFFDMLRLDVVRGDEWQLLLSLNPDLWSML
jgi:hypothetical protein